MDYLLTDFIRSGPDVTGRAMRQIVRVATRCAIDSGFAKDALRLNAFALGLALERYVRDSFGFQRITKLIDSGLDDLKDGIAISKLGDLNNLKSRLREEILRGSGVRIQSNSPYVHRKCALLLHHLVILRPFYIAGDYVGDAENDKIVYFNAFVAVSLINLVLKTIDREIPVCKRMLRNFTFHPPTGTAMEEIPRSAVRHLPS